MATGTSRLAAAGLLALGVALSGCGGTANPKGSPSAFTWLHPGPPPPGWALATIPSGAALHYPPGWRRLGGDPGTATVALLDRQQTFLGYLNITPRQGGETVAGWGRFRVTHNAKEGDRHLTTLAAASGLRFRTGRGACVKDAYTTKTGAPYIEIACLVVGRKSSTVIVGASPPQAWSRTAPMLERAISSFTT
jgi:hypothetical protein